MIMWRTVLHRYVKKLNSAFRAWGPHLMRLRSPPGAQIYLRFGGADADPSVKLAAAGAPLRNISEGEFNIGLFVLEEDGVSIDEQASAAAAAPGAVKYRGMMIQNHDVANFRFATVEWAAPAGAEGMDAGAAAVLQVDASDGRAKAVVDAAPHVDGFQIVLGAGVARLYIFGGALL